MDFRKALKWSLTYRGVAWGSLLLGGILVVVGVVVGFGDAFSILVEDPLNPQNAIAEANPMLTVAFTLVGFVLWRFGKTYALFVTLPKAAGRSAAEEFDTERVKSELLEVLDDRLSEIHEEVEGTRRKVEALERDAAADEFAADELATDPVADDAADRTTSYDESEDVQSSSEDAAATPAASGASGADPSGTAPSTGTADANSTVAEESDPADSDRRRETASGGTDDPGARNAESGDPLE